MKTRSTVSSAVVATLLAVACGYQGESTDQNVGAEENLGTSTQAFTERAPVAVPKTYTAKPVYMHVMPWFVTPGEWGGGDWGFHWKMNNKNPNN